MLKKEKLYLITNIVAADFRYGDFDTQDYLNILNALTQLPDDLPRELPAAWSKWFITLPVIYKQPTQLAVNQIEKSDEHAVRVLFCIFIFLAVKNSLKIKAQEVNLTLKINHALTRDCQLIDKKLQRYAAESKIKIHQHELMPLLKQFNEDLFRQSGREILAWVLQQLMINTLAVAIVLTLLCYVLSLSNVKDKPSQENLKRLADRNSFWLISFFAGAIGTALKECLPVMVRSGIYASSRLYQTLKTEPKPANPIAAELHSVITNSDSPETAVARLLKLD